MERKLVFSGSWYPSSLEELDTLVGVPGTGPYRMAVLPHAGLYFSASYIRSFFSALDKDVNNVLLLAPSHYYYLPEGQLVTASFTSTETPYGALVTQPIESWHAICRNEAIAKEHAIEMFLPFLGRLKGVSLSYALINHISSKVELEAIVDELMPLISDRTAVIASSDFTHYGPRFQYEIWGRNAEGKVKEHDAKVASALIANDQNALLGDYAEGTICGIAPATIVSTIAHRCGLSGLISAQGNSLTLCPGDDSFVSYVSILWR